MLYDYCCPAAAVQACQGPCNCCENRGALLCRHGGSRGVCRRAVEKCPTPHCTRCAIVSAGCEVSQCGSAAAETSFT